MRGASFHKMKPAISSRKTKQSQSLNRTKTRESVDHPNLTPKIMQFTPILQRDISPKNFEDVHPKMFKSFKSNFINPIRRRQSSQGYRSLRANSSYRFANRQNEKLETTTKQQLGEQLLVVRKSNLSDPFKFMSLDNQDLIEKIQLEQKRQQYSSLQPSRTGRTERAADKSSDDIKARPTSSSVKKRRGAPKFNVVMSIKDQIQYNKEQLVNIKRQILKNFTVLLQKSNGMSVIPSAKTYKYYIGKGNNSSLIRGWLKGRSQWSPIESDDQISTAHFVWTQNRQKPYIRNIPIISTKHTSDEAEQKLNVIENIRWPPGGLKNMKGQPINLAHLGFGQISHSMSYLALEQSDSTPTHCHNRLPKCYHLSNKKALFVNMKLYYELIGENPFWHMPQTFHIRNGVQDPQFLELENAVQKERAENLSHNIWIVKPGENTNRGRDIIVCSTLAEIVDIISKNNAGRTHIVQKYIERPLLIHRRKFDIRCFALVTAFNGVIQGYFYQDGYLRTTCKEYTIKNVTDRIIHLTNDAVQKYAGDYGKYEQGNKLSYKDFQKYVNQNFPVEKQFQFEEKILPFIKETIKDTIWATFTKLNLQNRSCCFELFGYDFMIDENLKTWLIEVNTNPCLELSSSYLANLLPKMLENAMKITLDTLFPPPPMIHKRKTPVKMDPVIPDNNFELIFSSEKDGVVLQKMMGDKFQQLWHENPVLVEVSDEEENELDSDVENEN